MLQSEFKSRVSTMRYVRPQQVRQLYPISMTRLYELLNQGDVKSVRIAGARWIDIASLEGYIASQAAEQAGKPFEPSHAMKARAKTSGAGKATEGSPKARRAV